MKISLKSLTLIGLSVACLSMASHSASAAIVTVPTGLNPGDTYYLAFVTAGTITGTSTNIADYNAFAQSQATGAGLNTISGSPVTWKAAVSTPTVSAVSNLGLGASPIYRINNALIATGASDLWDGTLLAALNVDQNDTVAPAGTEAWTGSNADGTGYTLFGGYQMGGGSGNSITGAVNSVSTTWMTNGGPNSANVRKVYAFSSPLIVPVPEPSTTAMLTAAVGSIIASQLRRLKRSNAPASSTRLSQRQSSTGIPASTF